VKRCLITGCEGFIGSHLADFLVARGLEVFGTVYDDTGNLKHLDGKISLFRCDLKDRARVETLVSEVKPDVVFHLAAQSFVTVSWENPEETLKTNTLGSFYLLEEIKNHAPEAIVEIIGSSAVYGPRRADELPLREETDYRPTSMYGVSKVGEEVLGYFYHKVFGLRVIRVRPFNMTGPRKLYDACSDFSKKIVEIEKGLKQELEVGNLDTVRDFTDGRDAVKALWLLTEKGEVGGLYNLCSGKERKIRDILTLLIKLSGNDLEFETVPEWLRPVDDPIYVGDNSKLRALGWKPEILIEKTLEDMLNWWREKL